MSLHAILETLIRHTTFRTEAEQHEALELLDSAVDHDDPAEGAIARTAFRPPVPTDASGQPIQVPTGMTSAQADELIALLKAQQLKPPLSAVDVPPEPKVTPAADMPAVEPVAATDVPEGVS